MCRWPPVRAHTLRLTYKLGLPAPRRRQLSAGTGLVGRAAARLQFRLHRSRGRALSRSLGAGEPDLGSVRRHPRAAGDGHGGRAQRRSRTGRSRRSERTTGASRFPIGTTAFSTLVEVRATNTLVDIIDDGDTAGQRHGRHDRGVQTRRQRGGRTWPRRCRTVSTWLVGKREQHRAGICTTDRFVAFIIQGGMEYDGGCTSSLGALRHEAYHSWWGRGVKPASQADGMVGRSVERLSRQRRRRDAAVRLRRKPPSRCRRAMRIRA